MPPDSPPNSTSPVCRRCGECCRKGGPTLHDEDLAVFETGLIRPEHLFTLRVGELVCDNVSGGSSVIPLEKELIKIVGKGGGHNPWHCVFHQPEAGCGIYSARPVQCRALFCEDPDSFRAVFAHNKLSRREILPLFSPQWLELAMAHEQECRVSELARLAGSKKPEDRQNMRELIRLDAAFRDVAAERGLVSFDCAPLVFGRSLDVMLNSLSQSGFH